MDILQNLVFPQSPTNILLLKYLLFLTLLLLLPYLSVMLGTTLFSVIHFNKGKKTGNRDYLVFANELIDLFTINKGMSLSLGLVPLISIMFIFSQLLLGSNLNVTSLLVFAIILMIIATIYVYTYKFSFRLKNLFSLVNDSNNSDKNVLHDFEGLQKSNSSLLSKSGVIGFILLSIVAYMVIGVLQVVVDTASWNGNLTIWNILLSVNTILYFLFYLAMSFSITTTAIVFKYFKNSSKEYDVNYLNYVKSFALKTGLIFTFVQPLLYVITLISGPSTSLSFPIFIVSAIALALMLIVSIIFYLMYKDGSTHLGGSAVLVFLILIAVIIYRDQLAFDTSSQTQIYHLNQDYEIFATQIKEDAGIKEIIEVNGEDIYNAKCIACHRFDTKLVGPAYNNILPKYEGKREELVDFILNPRKIDPEFTAMPSQGLKPIEAEAIADYIIKIYKSK